MMKSAAIGATRKAKSRGPRAREAPGRRLGKQTAAGRSDSLDLGPLDLVFLEAALVADLITAFTSKTKQRTPPRLPNLFKPFQPFPSLKIPAKGF